MTDRVLVWVAHGFGLGLMRPAPGTWGSLLGLPLAWALSTCEQMVAFGVWLALFAVGVAACNAASRHFDRKDPGQCVVDEYVALPLVCWGRPVDVMTLLLAFGLFRLFDIWKPWPVRTLERLPGGWGVMADDLAAAGYGAIVLAVIARFTTLL